MGRKEEEPLDDANVAALPLEKSFLSSARCSRTTPDNDEEERKEVKRGVSGPRKGANGGGRTR